MLQAWIFLGVLYVWTHVWTHRNRKANPLQIAIKASTCYDVPHNILDHGAFYCSFSFFVFITYLVKGVGYAELAWLYSYYVRIVPVKNTYRK